MSQSSRPTRWPSADRAQARLTATVDLPTPPLPLTTAITRFTCSNAVGGGLPLGSVRGSSGTLAAPRRTRVTPGPAALRRRRQHHLGLRTPGTAFSAASAASRTRA